MNSHTPYDDVYRTIGNDCPKLLIPLANEIYHENFTGEEDVMSGTNERFLEQQGGEEQKKITDSYFEIRGKDKQGKYHFECQSEPDSSMLYRMFEYDSQIGLENGQVSDNCLEIEMPKAAILYLRHYKSTPDVLHTIIKTAKGKFTYGIPILKVKNYTIDEIFKKNLIFLIPFHIFVYERQFFEYNNTKEKFFDLQKTYRNIRSRLESLSREKVIDEYTRYCIMDMSCKVINHLAKDFENLRKGLTEIMGGKVLDYEAKDIFNAGKAEGRSEGAVNAYVSLFRDGIITLAEAAKRLGMAEEDVKRYM